MSKTKDWLIREEAMTTHLTVRCPTCGHEVKPHQIRKDPQLELFDELLEALRKARLVLTSVRPGNPVIDRTIQEVRAAIAKAQEVKPEHVVECESSDTL